MPCCKPRNAYRTFNQSCEEREEVNLEHSPVQEILDLKEDGEEGNPQGYGKSHGINETISIVSKLRDVEVVTFAVFVSLLSFISGPKSQPSSWSLVSKMMQSKTVACEEETEV
ncbi:hypothetical protein CerSpe_286970 [Prunus speciosa]